MKNTFTVTLGTCVAIAILSCQSTGDETKSPSDAAGIKIKIESRIPTDLPPLNGRKYHTLQEAAIFAWQQFIAVTWPAREQDGSPGSRDTPYSGSKFKYGKPGPSRQVVWETFRHKSEIFPGVKAPHGYDSKGQIDYGYDDLPKYVYSDGEIMPASGAAPKVPPFNNLDEIDEIFLCNMHAGLAGDYGRVFYQVKANRVLYKYIAENKLFMQSSDQPGKMRANAVYNLTVDDPKKFKMPYVKLPSSDPDVNKVGSMEIKSAWRRLNTDKSSPYYEDPKRYYTATTRRYVYTAKGLRFIDSPPSETWGLIALHIIQKTQSSQTFVFTTFGQVDNIRAADGKPVEEPDGTTKPQYLRLNPFVPNLTITESKPPASGMDASGQIVVAGNGQFDARLPQLYYKNQKHFFHGIMQPIGINRRLFPIPPSITRVNSVAQKKIREYDKDAVWQHYRLVNVQAQTLKSFVDRSEVPKLNPDLKASFYLANIVVETNVPLQKFSGTLSPDDSVPGFSKSGNSDYFLDDWKLAVDPGQPVHLGHKKNKPAFNTYVRQNAGAGKAWRKLNIGGCLGCHGGQGQTFGGDFSVIVARGRVGLPDVSEGDTLELISRQKRATHRLRVFSGGK